MYILPLLPTSEDKYDIEKYWGSVDFNYRKQDTTLVINEKVIGVGSCFEVYKAYDPMRHQFVAIKIPKNQ